MRIQHNIMAMNAYRNYTNNVSAMKTNLEKLSSGYKINRAGDDAAGLAISEKMRAQITGLQTAQKNAKDGISLVQTAEGALTEVHDMLNRMVELATQSANGTYDNTTDRFQLQKEMDQLNSEIDRIADSANFNGIKLLDGSLDANKDMTLKMDFAVGGDLPGVGQKLGVDTVLHSAVVDPTKGSEFSLDLHDYEFNDQKGDTMNITIGDTKIELTRLTANTSDDALKGADLATAILGGTTTDYSVKVNGNIYNTGDSMYFSNQEFKVTDGGKGRINFAQAAAPTDETEDVDPSMKVTIGGKVQATPAKFSFDLQNPGITLANGDTLHLGDEDITVAGTGVSDYRDAINAQSQYFKADVDGNKIVLTAKSGGPMNAPSISISNATAPAANVLDKTGNGTASTAGANGTAGVYKTAVIATSKSVEIGGTTFNQGTDYSTGTDVNIDGVTYTVTGDLRTADQQLTITVKATNGVVPDKELSAPSYTHDGTVQNTTEATKHVASTHQIGTYDLSVWKGGKISIFGTDVKWNGVDAASSIQAAIDDGTLNNANFSFTYDSANNRLMATAKKAGDATGSGIAALAAADLKITNGVDRKVSVEQKGADAVIDPTKGDYNVSTTVLRKVSAADSHRLASTYFDLTKEMATEGSTLTIADQTFTFTAKAENIGKAGYVDISSGDINTIAQKLTEAAKNNHVYTVGHDGSRISLTETLAHDAEYVVSGKVVSPMDGWDLRTAEGIEKSLSFTSADVKSGKPLTLQIGDTADSFNQLNVNIKDMHAASLGLDKISIADQDSAAKAVDVIKNAINTVSDVRGTLGATQNRLDHTINNLSVMTENIQDAESTIRDTDVASEMMQYTKNNILIQSAQAMLAQANQVPQGVLQLLQ